MGPSGYLVQRTFGSAKAYVYKSKEELGEAAAAPASSVIRDAIRGNGARVVPVPMAAAIRTNRMQNREIFNGLLSFTEPHPVELYTSFTCEH